MIKNNKLYLNKGDINIHVDITIIQYFSCFSTSSKLALKPLIIFLFYEINLVSFLQKKSFSILVYALSKWVCRFLYKVCHIGIGLVCYW